MTVEELSQYQHLEREIEDLGRRCGGNRKYQAQITSLRQRAEEEKLKIVKYVGSVQDSLVRQIIVHRFIDNMTWARVSITVGGGNTEASCKMLLRRYMKKH